MQRDDASERRTQEAANRGCLPAAGAATDAERQEWEQTQREFARQHAALTAEVSDGLFGVLRGLTDASGVMVDVWSDADRMPSRPPFCARSPTMAAKALVANILIPVGVTSTGTTAAGGVDCSAFLGLFGGRSTGTTQVPRVTVWRTDELGAVIGAPVGGTPGAAGTLVAGAGLGIRRRHHAERRVTAGGAWARRPRKPSGPRPAPSAGSVIGTAIPVIGNVVGAIAGAIIGVAGAHNRSCICWARNPISPNFCQCHPDGRESKARWVSAGSAVRGPFGFVGPTGAFQQERPYVPGPEFARAFALLDTASSASHLSRRQAPHRRGRPASPGPWPTDFLEDAPIMNSPTLPSTGSSQRTLGGSARDVGLRPGFQSRVLRGIGTEEEDIPAPEAAFAKATQFLETLRQLKHPGEAHGQAERCSKALTETFADLADEARHYGVSLQVIHQAMKRQLMMFWEDIAASPEDARATASVAGHWWDGADWTWRVGFMTPATIFARRQAESEALQGEFAGAGAGAPRPWPQSFSDGSRRRPFQWGPEPMPPGKTGRPCCASSTICCASWTRLNRVAREWSLQSADTAAAESASRLTRGHSAVQ